MRRVSVTAGHQRTATGEKAAAAVTLDLLRKSLVAYAGGQRVGGRGRRRLALSSTNLLSEGSAQIEGEGGVPETPESLRRFNELCEILWSFIQDLERVRHQKRKPSVDKVLRVAHAVWPTRVFLSGVVAKPALAQDPGDRRAMPALDSGVAGRRNDRTRGTVVRPGILLSVCRIDRAGVQRCQH